MSDCMTFPDTVEEFMEQYKVVDTDQVYSNGTEFVPVFRMKQWFEHLQPDRMKLVQQAVNTIMNTSRSDSIRDRAFRNAARFVQCAIDGEAPDFEQIPEGDEMPSAQPERDIPQKPNKGIDHIDDTWDISVTIAVCPRCNCCVGKRYFDVVGHMVSYCENCGQAIDWEGWEED